jgi:hypothetical protein
MCIRKSGVWRREGAAVVAGAWSLESAVCSLDSGPLEFDDVLQRKRNFNVDSPCCQ